MIAKSESGSSKEDGPVSEEARRIFGRNCRDARLKHGMSQQDLAERTGIDQTRISKIELGKLNITLETMAQLAQVVDHDLAHLLTPASIKPE